MTAAVGHKTRRRARGRRGDPERVLNGLRAMGFESALTIVAAQHHVDPLNVCGFSRRQNASIARHMMWAVMRLKEQTFREIGEAWDCRGNAVFEALRHEDLMQAAAELIEVNKL